MVLAGPRRDCSDYPSLSMGSDNIVKSEFVTLLGVELDDRLTLKSHIRNIAKNCFFKLRNVYKIRKCITEDAAKIMVNNMTTPKLDYCNAILYELSNCDLDKLYSVEKLAARLSTGIRKHGHITPLLKQLHWLLHWLCLNVSKELHKNIYLNCWKDAETKALEEIIKTFWLSQELKKLLKVDVVSEDLLQYCGTICQTV